VALAKFYEYKNRRESPYVESTDGEKIQVFVYCRQCHDGLCKAMTIYRKDTNDYFLLVDPCPKCMLEAKTGGHEISPTVSSLERRAGKDYKDVMGG